MTKKRSPASRQEDYLRTWAWDGFESRRSTFQALRGGGNRHKGTKVDFFKYQRSKTYNRC